MTPGGEVYEVLAWDFALAEVLPVNENVPRGDNVKSCVERESCKLGGEWA